MTVPYSFGAATSAIPLSQLDSNFNTPITLGNTAIQLGNTVTTLNNMTLANVTISSGNVTITNVTVTTANATTVNTTTLIATTANVTTGNVTNLISGNVSLTGGSITGTPISGSTGSFTTLTTSSTVTLNGGTANGVAYLNGSKVLTTGTALVFDGSNLGLGVTPSASWFTGSKVIQFGTTGALWNNGSNNTAISHNAVFANASTTYLTTAEASYYRQLSGQHQWFTAPSGTAGTAITFTQAMTLDASGNLGLGATSISALGSGYTTQAVQGTNGAGFRLYAGATEYGRMYADSGGAYLQSVGASTPIVFLRNAGVESARIDSSGNLLVAQTATGLKNLNSMSLEPSNGYGTFSHINGAASGSAYIYFGYNAGGIGSITQNGTTGVLYNITSDYRLKDVVGAVSGSGERIDALKPVNYTWKADGSAARGFLVHEFQSIYANSVTGSKDAVDEDGNPVYQQMQASTTEVIADLVAELQSLRRRVAQLESKGE